MITDNFIFINENKNAADTPNPFLERYLRQADRRQLLNELLKEAELRYGTDAAITIHNKVDFT